MHIFQSMILPLVEKELVAHESEIGRVILTQLHGLLNKFIAHTDTNSAVPVTNTHQKGEEDG